MAWQGWGDVYFFCGSDYRYCRCDFTWNFDGWVKALVIWSFVVTACLGLQKLVIHAGLNGLLPGIGCQHAVADTHKHSFLRAHACSVMCHLETVASVTHACACCYGCCVKDALSITHCPKSRCGFIGPDCTNLQRTYHLMSSCLCRRGGGDKGEPGQLLLAPDSLLAQQLGAAVGC